MVLSLPILSTENTFALDLLNLGDDLPDDLESEAETGPLESSQELNAFFAEEASKPPSQLQEPLPDHLLTSDQQYHADIARYTPLGRLSDEQKQTLAERARQGNQQARAEMIHCLLHAVECFAIKYFLAHSWQSARLECAELIAVGNEALCASLDRALVKDHPYAYMLTVTYNTIRAYALTYRSLITIPSGTAAKGVVAPPTESLDAPLSVENITTLADLLAEPQQSYTPAEAGDETPLHQAIEDLPLPLRTVVSQLYGFGGMGVERIADLCSDPDGKTHTFESVQAQKVRALALLYLALKDAYPRYVAKTSEAFSVPYHATLVRRVEQTYDAFQAGGEPITVSRLAQASRVERSTVSAFLRQIGFCRGSRTFRQQPETYRKREQERAQRLDYAYARLQAMGQLFSQQDLIKEAHAHYASVRPYLQRRLDEACADLRAKGLPISGQRLSALTHLDRHTVNRYLLHQVVHEMEKTA